MALSIAARAERTAMRLPWRPLNQQLL